MPASDDKKRGQEDFWFLAAHAALTLLLTIPTVVAIGSMRHDARARQICAAAGMRYAGGVPETCVDRQGLLRDYAELTRGAR